MMPRKRNDVEGGLIRGKEEKGSGEGDLDRLGFVLKFGGKFCWEAVRVSAAKDPLTFDELMATSIDFSKYAMNRLKIDNLTQAHLNILSMVNVNVKKLHGYGHLEEIVVRRVDRQLYKFKEGDFVDLHLNDVEDMLLLAV
ncbi:hypothetical protein Tco_0905295 [Tanacetum coccineum]